MTSPLWYPANLVERELAWALSTGGFARFFQIFAGAELFVPVRATGGEQHEQWDPVTREVLGETVVPVFTSDEGLLAIMGDDFAELYVTGLDHLRATWPEPRWRLAINPGSPIEAYLPLDRMDAAVRDEQLPSTDPSVTIQSLDDGDWTPWPPGGPEQAMLEWTAVGDGAEYLAALLSCMVLVPTTLEVSEAEASEHYLRSLRARSEPAGMAEFPWRFTGAPQGRSVAVFTNQQLFDRAYPGSPSVRTVFQSLFVMLPPGCGLSVNPGGPGGLDLTGDELPLLARWRTLDPVPRAVLLGMRWARDALAQ